MNRQLRSLLCLTLLAIMPACRKCKKEKAAKQQENINTTIEMNNSSEEEEKTELKKSVIKF